MAQTIRIDTGSVKAVDWLVNELKNRIAAACKVPGVLCTTRVHWERGSQEVATLLWVMPDPAKILHLSVKVTGNAGSKRVDAEFTTSPADAGLEILYAFLLTKGMTRIESAEALDMTRFL